MAVRAGGLAANTIRWTVTGVRRRIWEQHVDVLIGLDVGTTAVKALAFDTAGRQIGAASHAYDRGLLVPRSGWVEQDPEDLWQGAVSALRSVLVRLPAGARPIALCQSSQGGTLIPLGTDGAPIYNAISWMDQRGAELAGEVATALGADAIYRTTGWHLGAALPLLQLAWLRCERPELLARARQLTFVNDFITQRLTGRWVMNPSDATMTQLFSIAESRWDPQLLSHVGIEVGQLAPLLPTGAPVGRLTEGASALLGLDRETLVVNGAHDQYCAAVGTGVIRPGAMLLSCGTAWVLLGVPESLDAGLASGLSISCHVLPGLWGAIHSLGGVGAALEWVARELFQVTGEHDRAEGYARLNAEAAASPAGASGLTFLPPAGGRAGMGGPHGGWLGLTLDHRRGDLARAVMEGTVCELHWAIDEIRVSGVPISALKMVGGAAESPLWPQIVADMIGVEVALPPVSQAAAAGAAVLAGLGAGVYASVEEGYQALASQEALRTPSQEMADGYGVRYETYRQVREALGRLVA